MAHQESEESKKYSRDSLSLMEGRGLNLPCYRPGASSVRYIQQKSLGGKIPACFFLREP